MIALGTADRPAFDSRYLPLELVAAGYEANGADTDLLGEWMWSTHRTRTLGQLTWMRDYRASADEAFEAHVANYMSAHTEEENT